jgi:hypothetical protein
MLSGLKKNSTLPKYTAILNQRAKKIIQSLLDDMIIKSIPKNKNDITVSIHNLVSVVMSKMIMVGNMLYNSLSDRK